MGIEQLLADLRAFAAGQHESYLLSIEQAKVLTSEIEMLRADVVFLRSLAGAISGGGSFREITKDARREAPIGDTGGNG